MMAAAFTGFSARSAHVARGIGRSPQKRDRSIVRQACSRFPDRPGSSHSAMTELNAALATAESELKEQKEC